MLILMKFLQKEIKRLKLLGIQSRRLKELMDDGLIEDFRHMEMANMLVEFYTLQGQKRAY